MSNTTENLRGVKIKWLNPSPNYTNILQSDFEVVRSSHPCPSYYGDPIEGLLVGEEWLAIMNEDYPSDFSDKMFKLVQSTLPTNQKHPDFPNYNVYLTKFDRISRDLPELIDVILQLENEANMSIQSESEKAKMAQLAPCVAAKYGNSPLTTEEQNVYNRMIEVGGKVMQNAANASALIAIANNNANPLNTKKTFDIETGWIFDDITPQGFPLENSVV